MTRWKNIHELETFDNAQDRKRKARFNRDNFAGVNIHTDHTKDGRHRLDQIQPPDNLDDGRNRELGDFVKEKEPLRHQRQP